MNENSKALIDGLGNRKRETKKAKRALVDYALMEHRSIDVLLGKYRKVKAKTYHQPPTRRKNTIYTWSSKYDWQARVVEFDNERERQRIEKWLSRKEILNEEDWKTGGALRSAARNFIKDVDTEKITISQVANALLTASKLQRLASHEPTENLDISGNALINLIEKELARVGYADATDVVEEAPEDAGETGDPA